MRSTGRPTARSMTGRLRGLPRDNRRCSDKRYTPDQPVQRRRSSTGTVRLDQGATLGGRRGGRLEV